MPKHLRGFAGLKAVNFTSMASRQSESPSTFDIQTLQPRVRLHGPVLLLIFLATVPLLFFMMRGINRFVYSGLSLLMVFGFLFHFRKEYQLVHDRLTALGVVTEYRAPWRPKSWVGRLIAWKFSQNIPVIKYSFVAFDQKTYTGETGFHTQGLYKGAHIPVLYNPGNPSLNHPMTSFIFYSFQSPY